MNFNELGLSHEITRVLVEEGYVNPSPIQEQAIPVILAGEDIIGTALTGTGKTAAFALPLLEVLAKRAKEGPRNNFSVLVLAPTRELTEQIKDSFLTYSRYLPIKTGAIYGGVSQKKQEAMLEKGTDVLVATPGRLMDLYEQKIISFENVTTFVLDEADTMLDMGFIKDVYFINSLLHQKRQTLLFSATFNEEVKQLAGRLLTKPKLVLTNTKEEMLDTITHRIIYVTKEEKREALLDLLVNPDFSSVLLFTKTKHVANKLVPFLQVFGVKCDVIHSNKSQTKRQKALNDFKDHKIRILIATDIASRGIDIDSLTHVLNFDMPATSETYVHRIGRTGRAGKTGAAISFVMDPEKYLLRTIKRDTNLTFVEEDYVMLPTEMRLPKDPNYRKPQPIKHQELKRIAKEKQESQNVKPQKVKKKKIDPLFAEANREDSRKKGSIERKQSPQAHKNKNNFNKENRKKR